MTAPRALITGITGQDGSYLAELLLAKGYEVHGMIRRASTLQHRAGSTTSTAIRTILSARLFLHYGDLTDGTGLRRILERVRPDEVYNLGAQSHVRVSFDEPEYTADVDGDGHARLLEAAAGLRRPHRTQRRASTRPARRRCSARAAAAERATPFHPRSPYAVGKVAAHWYAVNYREAYGLFIVQRDPVQPRVAAPRRDVRHPQDHARGRPDQARGSRRSSTSATSTRAATGASPATTSRRCG